jgi:hypothetical protein
MTRILGIFCDRGKGYIAIGRLCIYHMEKDCAFWWRPWVEKDDIDITLFIGRLAFTWNKKKK